MKKWKKALAGTLCFLMAASPAGVTSTAMVLAAEETAGSTAMEETAGSTAEEPAAEVKDGLVNENGKYYYYKDGQMVKGAWQNVTTTGSDGKTVTYRYYFRENGAAYAATKGQGTLVRKIKGKYYGFNTYGRMITSAFRNVKVKKGKSTVTNRYYFGKNGAAYAGTKAYGVTQISVKKISGKYYGFNTNGTMVKGTWVKGDKFYVFNSRTGVYNASKTKQLRTAAGYEKDATRLRSLLGAPKKTIETTTCYEAGMDLILFYDNFTVTLFRSSVTGKEIVLGVASR